MTYVKNTNYKKPLFIIGTDLVKNLIVVTH